jgi:hypothetical protein
MNEPLVLGLIVLVLVALLVAVDRMRRPRPGEVDAAIGRAAVDADRDVQKTQAVEAKETAGHQWPPGGSL